MAQPDKISIEEIKEALTRSGYLLESRIEMVLRNEGYWVESNQAYSDPYTKKSREFDLVANKTLEEDLQHGRRISLSPMLLIECINNLQPVAFITKNKDAILSGADPGVAGYPPQIGVEQRAIPIHEFLGFACFHHYYKGGSATQYCSFQYKEKQKEWMAWHDDDYHDVFSTLGFVKG